MYRSNGIWIDSASIAIAYKKRWDDLKAGGSDYPRSLAQSGSIPAKASLNGSALTE